MTEKSRLARQNGRWLPRRLIYESHTRDLISSFNTSGKTDEVFGGLDSVLITCAWHVCWDKYEEMNNMPSGFEITTLTKHNAGIRGHVYDLLPMAGVALMVLGCVQKILNEISTSPLTEAKTVLTAVNLVFLRWFGKGW